MTPAKEPGLLRSVLRSGLSERGQKEVSLVLDSLSIDYRVERSPGGYILTVDPSDEAVARTALTEYAAENKGWPGEEEPLPVLSPHRVSHVFYAATLSAFHWLSLRHVGGIDWHQEGMAQAGKVQQGEWWRSITSLCLHLDERHLLGNIVFGILFGFFVCQLFGPGVGWGAILAAGILGNLVATAIHPATHAAVGASTAVFGSVGLLAAYQWARRRDAGAGPLHRRAPLLIGLALLGYLGTSGDHTDILSHVTGFLAGLFLGSLLAGQRHKLPASPVAQIGWAVGVAVTLAGAWWKALQS